MKVAFVSDLHIAEDRLDLHREILAATAAAIYVRAPDVILIGGDLAGRTVPHLATPGERNAMIEFLDALPSGIPVVVCRGNHDSPGDWAFLDSISGVHYAERPSVVVVRGEGDEFFEIVVLPWHETWSEDWLAEADAAFGEKVYETRICLTHATFEGARLRVGQPEVPTRDCSVLAETLCERFSVDYIFSGHYHAFQGIGSGHGVYAGSLFYNEFGESGPKGFVFCDFLDGGGWRHVPIEQPKRYRAERQPGGGYSVTPTVVGRPGALTMAELRDLEGPVKVVESCPKDRLAARRAALSAVRLPEGSRIHLTPTEAPRAREGAESVLSAPDLSTKFARWAERSDAAPKTVARAADLLPAIVHES